MIPFLHNVAQTYYNKYEDKVSSFTFVFPNRRAGVFFQKYLAEVASKPLFSPHIYTISDLITELSGYRKVDRIESLFLLYDIYRKISSSTESFDDFLYWGEMLLNDFDDVDKYLVDAKQLFQNIKDLKDIDAGFDYLEPEQLDAIRHFWSNFLPILNNDKKKQFLEIWEVLYALYTQLRNVLHENGLAYEGMIFRDVAEKAKRGECEIETERIVFVGLNGHSKSEDVLLKYFRDRGIADFYWDYSSPLVRDASNKASLFADYNRLNYKSQLSLLPEDQTIYKPMIEAIGIPSSIGQPKYSHQILKELRERGILTDKNEVNTAIVLPDENLLLPVLYSIPEEVSKVNVTMGYNLSNSSISGLIEYIIDLQKNIKKDGFYHRGVTTVLNHRYIINIAGDKAKKLTESIFKYNKIIVPFADFEEDSVLKTIFTPVFDWRDIPDYLRTILSALQSYFFVLQRDETIEDAQVRAIDIENEFVVEYYKTINKMDEFMINNVPEMSVDTYFRLLRKMVGGISVPFNGEPLSGLQIMGVLETRALDFENLIILNMNEGVFPLKRAASSFVPYNLRRGFDLPTYEHQDGIYAYHFYRIINRAKRIYLLYDTRTEGLNSGEISRYFTQIKNLYANDFQIKEKLVTYKISSNDSLSISIDKSPEIREKLNQFLSGGTRSLSASSINMYLNCPLQFYLSIVENLSEEDDVSETIESNMFGTIYHYIMENIYRPLEGKMITADILDKIYKDEKYLTQLIETSFAVNYFKLEDRVKKLTGQNYLTGEVLRKYIKQTLKTDKKLTPFIYQQSEKRIHIEYELPSGKRVSLKSFIDRIDIVKGRTRIIDYKTGKGELGFRKLEDLFAKDMKNRPKAVMQVFLYAHLYLLETPDECIEPGIYYLRDLFGKNFSSCVVQNRDRKVEDFDKYRDEFKELLHSCLDEIFDAKVPFSQTSTSEACLWCPFTNICRK